METGCQNIQLCLVILKVAFPPQVIGPMFLFPLVYITLQCTEALLLALCFRCCQTLKPPAEGKCHSCLCFQRGKLGRGAEGSEDHVHAFSQSVLNLDQTLSNITLFLRRCKRGL